MGILTSGLAQEQWVFFIGNWLMFLQPCLYGMGRSMITKCVLKSEYGKVLSGNALISSFCFFAGTLLFRLIYDATIESTPNTVLILGACLMFTYAAGNVFIFFKRGLFVKKALNDKEYGEKSEDVDPFQAIIME